MSTSITLRLLLLTTVPLGACTAPADTEDDPTLQLRGVPMDAEIRPFPEHALDGPRYHALATLVLDAAAAATPQETAAVLAASPSWSIESEARLVVGGLAYAWAYQRASGELPELEELSAYVATHHFNALLRERVGEGVPFDDAYFGLGNDFPDDLAPPHYFDPEEYLGLGEHGLRPPEIATEHLVDVLTDVGDVLAELDALLDQMQDVLESGMLGSWNSGDFAGAVAKTSLMGATGGAVTGGLAGSAVGGAGALPGAIGGAKVGALGGAAAGAAGYTAEQLFWSFVDSLAHYRDDDGDGVANWLDDDMDGDGIPNDEDSDKDGDGVENDDDRAPNNKKRSISACHEYPYACFGIPEQPEDVMAWLTLVDPVSAQSFSSGAVDLDDYVAFTWE